LLQNGMLHFVFWNTIHFSSSSQHVTRRGRVHDSVLQRLQALFIIVRNDDHRLILTNTLDSCYRDFFALVILEEFNAKVENL